MQPREWVDMGVDVESHETALALKRAEPGRLIRLRGRCLTARGLTARLLVAGAVLLTLPFQAEAQTDRAALVALYNTTGGANWTTNTNWSSTEPLSEWHGVQTDVDDRVTHVSLGQNGLSGSIPAELGDLTSLQFLYLWGNELSGSIPAELGDLTSLQQLSLSQNGLTGGIPTELGNLSSLQQLYLNQNELSGSIPAELGDLTNLQELYLPQNGLSGSIPAELGDLTSLQQLYLNQNGLGGEIPTELGNLSNLQILYLWGNELNGEIPTELGNLSSLQQLSLSRNQLSGAIPTELGNLSSLQQLYLDQNELSGSIPASLGNLSSLQELLLNQNGLSGAIPLSLSALSQLLVLDVQDTMLCAPADSAFQAWLETIDFRGAVCGAPPPPPPVPDAPTNLLAVGGDGQVVLTWEAPEDDGGSEITDYEYRIDQTGEWISTGSTDTTHTVTGLVNGTAYVFEVRAVNEAGNSVSSNQTEATPELFTLDFAHFANGEDITSELVLVNVATHPIRLGLYFYDQGGNPIAAETVVDITEDLEITEDGSLSVRTAMEPLGELTISTHGRGEVVSGSVKAVSNGPMGGVLRFGLPGIGVAGVGASLPLTDALFPARRAGGISTAAAIRNLSESELMVSCRLMQADIVLEETEIPLEANGQEAQYIEEMFTHTDTSDFVGSVRCTAPPGEGMFTGVAVELDAENRIFTTLPVVPVDAAGGGGRETVLDFAHFANGAGITSELVFVNRSTQPSRPAPTHFHSDILPNLPVLYFYDQSGDLIDPASVVDVTGDLVVTEDSSLTVQTEMEPLGVLTISTHGRGELLSGSVKVTSDRPTGGFLRFSLPDIGVAGVGTSLPVMDALFPARRHAGEISTAAAIRNLGEEAMVVSCRLMQEGMVLEEAEISLAANGQEALYIEEMFTGTDTSDFVGSVRCMAPSEGEGMFTGLAVELDAENQIFTTLPVVPIPERMSQE